MSDTMTNVARYGILVFVYFHATANPVHGAPPVATPDVEYNAICGPTPPADDATDVFLSVEDFGAQGGDAAYDLGDNDLEALRLAATALCDRSSGETRRKTLYFPNDPLDASDGTYHLEGSRDFYDVDLSHWGVLYDHCSNVRIFGCGSRLEIVPFDRHWIDEGPPYGPFYNASDFQVIPFLFDRAEAMELRGFVLDGNAEQIVLDSVINAEGPDTGVMTLASRDYRIADFEVRAMLEDGILIGVDTPDDQDFVFDDIRAYGNCRNGLSLIQAREGLVLNAVMNDSGNCGALTWDGAQFGAFPGFSPRAGITLEPDCFIGLPGCELFTTRAGNITFDNLHAEGNWGFGLASGHSDRVENVTVVNSTLISTPPAARGRCSVATATNCNADPDCPVGEACIYAYCAPDVGQGLAGDGECSDPLWLNDGLAENLSIHTSRGRIVLAGGGSMEGDEVIFRDNVVSGGSVLLQAQGSFIGPALVEISGNSFLGVHEHGPAERLPLIFVADSRSCNTRSWRFVNNYVELPANHREAPYFNATTVLGLLAESSGNTFASADPAAVFYMGFDDTRFIDDDLTPVASWEPLGLAGCVSGAGDVVYDETNAPGCEDAAFEACDGIAGEVPGLWFDDHMTLRWWPQYQAGTYHVYRAGLETVSLGSYGQCLQTGITATTTTDLDVPLSGNGFFYLVTSVSSIGSEGTKGFSSAGERLGNVCP